MSELFPHNSRESLAHSLIVGGLGYCCEYWFWQHFREVPTELLAARLGVHPRTVRRWRKGPHLCEKKPGPACFDQRLGRSLDLLNAAKSAETKHPTKDV